MPVFKASDRYQAVVDVAEARGACAPAIAWCRARGRVSLGEGLQQMLKGDFKAAWAYWVWKVLADVTDGLTREVFFKIILRENQVASVVFLEEISLTDAQDTRLQAAFSSKLPAMKRGIESGRFKRAKSVV